MKRHPFDPISFISGALLVGLGLAILAGDTTRPLGTWLVPAAVIGLGILFVTLGWQSSRTSQDATPESDA